MNIYIYIYIYIYICVCVCVCMCVCVCVCVCVHKKIFLYFFVGPKREKSKYFKMNRSTERFGLVCLVLWHINLCRLFNAKSIFM